ncbi:MAG: hypothetical protein ACTHOK_02255 [Nocardioidaceae bacterium]
MPTLRRVDIPESVITELEKDLEHLEDLTAARVHAELVSYLPVEPTALRVSVGRNLAIAVRALRAGVPPAVSDLVEATKTTRERFAVGIAVEEILRAFRVSISIIQERFVETCFANQVPAETILAGSGHERDERCLATSARQGRGCHSLGVGRCRCRRQRRGRRSSPGRSPQR